MKLSRRDMLKGTGTMMVGSVLGGLSFSALGSQAASGQQEAPPELPWPYKKLNPQEAGESGYYGFYKGACCYGAFEAIMGQLRREVGYPYTVVPTTMMVFGEGGVAGVSSLCGALNGAASAIFLTKGGLERERREAAFALIRELFNWYEQTPLPDYRPKSPKFEIVRSVSRSPLCHVSVSTWCKTSKFKSFSKERSERCAWLTGTVAKKAIELLNASSEGAFKPAYGLTADTKTCRSCHDQGSMLENTRGLMDCGGCHFPERPKHPKI
jgi:hypothetical protein